MSAYIQTISSLRIHVKHQSIPKSDKNWYRCAYVNKGSTHSMSVTACHAVGSAHKAQHMSGIFWYILVYSVRSVPTATIANYHNLSDLEHGVTVGARDMGHSTTISRLYFK